MSQFPVEAARVAPPKHIKDHVVANLDHYLLEFEAHAIASGAKVLTGRNDRRGGLAKNRRAPVQGGGREAH